MNGYPLQSMMQDRARGVSRFGTPGPKPAQVDTGPRGVSPLHQTMYRPGAIVNAPPAGGVMPSFDRPEWQRPAPVPGMFPSIPAGFGSPVRRGMGQGVANPQLLSLFSSLFGGDVQRYF